MNKPNIAIVCFCFDLLAYMQSLLFSQRSRRSTTLGNVSRTALIPENGARRFSIESEFPTAKTPKPTEANPRDQGISLRSPNFKTIPRKRCCLSRTRLRCTCLSLTLGKGTSGTSFPKNWHSGTQPSARLKFKSLSGGTAARISW